MFDIFRSVKRITGFGKKSENPEKSVIQDKTEKVSGFFNKLIEQILEEIENIREKSKNLEETNLNLGISHLEKGNLKEAIFRFKITKKFWPKCYEAYYQLIVCLILSHKLTEAEKVKNELLTKKPSYQHKIDMIMKSSEPLQNEFNA